MPYNKTSIQSAQKNPYTRPSRTQKSKLCYYQACKGKSVDPRTKVAYTKNPIMPQQEYTVNFLKVSGIPFVDLIHPDPEIDINYNKGSQKESYSFLVKRTSISFQKSRISKTSLPKVINELFSDNNNNNTSEDSERDSEDDILEYSSDESEEACQVNFNTLEMESEQTNFRHAEELDNTFL